MRNAFFAWATSGASTANRTLVVFQSVRELPSRAQTLSPVVVVIYRPAVLNLLRLEDHLHVLALGRRPPLKIVPWKIAKIGMFVCLYAKKVET